MPRPLHMTYSLDVLIRGAGATRSERLLARLADYSFLRLWAFPNIYRDQGGGKEIADLMVVFDDDVVLFSDKEIAFPSGPVDVAWHRWKRRAIDDSIAQLRGARRWLLQYPHRIYLDKECRRPFPFPLKPSKMRIHLVCVANGAAKACRQAIGGSGSLCMVDDRWLTETTSRPFVLPAVHDEQVFHVLDEVTLPILLGELDTASDFIGYLRHRQDFISGGLLAFSPGEEHMLGAYLAGAFLRGRLSFPKTDRPVVFSDDHWTGISEDERFQQHRTAMAAGYAWDQLIETFNECIIDGSMLFGNEGGVAGHESRLRVLARTTRAERAELAKAFAQLFVAPREPSATLFRCVRLSTRHDTIFALVLMPPEDFAEPEYRDRRALVLHDYCFAIKAAHPEVLDVVGVATSPAREGLHIHSEDVICVDGRSWTPELQRIAENIRATTGLYTSPKLSLTARKMRKFLTSDQNRKLRNNLKRERRRRRAE